MLSLINTRKNMRLHFRIILIVAWLFCINQGGFADSQNVEINSEVKSIHASEIKEKRFQAESGGNIDLKKIKGKIFYFNPEDKIPLFVDAKTTIAEYDSVLYLTVTKTVYFRFHITEKAIEFQKTGFETQVSVPDDFDLLVSFDKQNWISFFNLENLSNLVSQRKRSNFSFNFQMTPEYGFFLEFLLRMPSRQE